MQNTKFYVVTALLIVGAGFLGYGAIASLRDPVYYVNNQTLTAVGDLNAQSQEPAPIAPASEVMPVETAEPVTEPEPAEEPVSKNADLIARLKKIPAGTVLKNGSKGDHVKALQEALNIAINAGLPTNGTFGDQTEAKVKAFQTSVKISPATGQVASKTLAALVDKLDD